MAGLRFKILEVDKERRRQHERAVLEPICFGGKLDGEIILVGKDLRKSARPALSHRCGDAPGAAKFECPEFPNRRPNFEDHLAALVFYVKAFRENRKALLDRAERAAVRLANL